MTEEIKNNFINDFDTLTPLEHFEKYISTTGFDNTTERGKEDIFTACALLIRKDELVKFIKENNLKITNAWDNVNAVIKVAEHFDVHPAVARYRMLSIAKYSQKDNTVSC